MLRSIWFWVIAILLGLTLWFGRDQISSYFDKLPMSAQQRTTNTRLLASATPRPPTATPQLEEQEVLLTVMAARTPAPELNPNPQPTPPPPTPTYATYVVEQGDTLYSIAKRCDSDVPTLQKLNNLEDVTLVVGQTLKVPKPVQAPQPTQPAIKAGTRLYTVLAGDTLSSIARKFETSVTHLQALNNLSNPNNLVVGATILVPAPTGATPAPEATTPTPQETATENAAPAQETSAVDDASAIAPPQDTATPTPVPIPTMPSVCKGTQEAVFVWGVSFCVPPSWQLKEYELPNGDHTAFLIKTEESGVHSIYAISRIDGAPNAPLSWSMRQARKAISTEVNEYIIPGELQEPEEWGPTSGLEIAHEEGQVAEAKTIYLPGGQAAHVRVIVFNHNDRRWRIIMVAPETLWQSYDVTIFSTIARNLETF